MSPYATELAHARLDALRTLVDALNEAETPEEKRRCAVAIFKAPDPCDLDDRIELEDGVEADAAAEQFAANQHADTAGSPALKHASPANTASQSPLPHSTSHIEHPTFQVEHLSPAESRLRAREARSTSQLHHILAQLPALPIPAS